MLTIKVTRKALLENISLAKPPTKSKLIPIINTIAIRRDGKAKDRCLYESTDLDHYLRIPLNVDSVEGQGQMIVDSDSLITAVKNVPEGLLTITVNGKSANIDYGKGKVSFYAFDPNEYPKFPDVSGKARKVIKAEQMMSCLDKVQHAVSQDASKYNLNGINIEIDPKKKVLLATATDGHRMATMRHGEKPAKTAKAYETFFVGGNVIKQAIAFCKASPDSDVSFTKLAEPSIGTAMSIGDVVIITRHDGHFPDYRRVIPKSVGKSILMRKDELRSTLTRATKIANSKNIRLQFSKGSALVGTTNHDGPTVEEQINAKFARDLTVGYNVGYICDFIKVAVGDEIGVNAKDNLSPALLVDPSTPNLTEVLMPVRI